MDHDEKAVVDSQHVEQSITQDRLDSLAQQGDIKHVKVHSVALADAVAKDNQSKWTWAMFRLYGIMAFVTLSKSNRCSNLGKMKLTSLTR